MSMYMYMYLVHVMCVFSNLHCAFTCTFPNILYSSDHIIIIIIIIGKRKRGSWWNMKLRQRELEKVIAACRTRETPEQHLVRLEGDRLRSRRRKTLETLNDRVGRLEADRIRVCRQITVETPVHQKARLEVERSRSRRRREARIPTQAEDPETN